MSYYEDKEILITGGTGSLGKALIKILQQELYDYRGIRIYSRDEYKQWELKKELDKLGLSERVSFLIGDIRDKQRLSRVLNGVDIVINTAAMKQVPACEYNPIEAVRTNIEGVINLIDAAIDNGVEKVMHISTDKCVEPVNLYGATKTVAERLFIQGNVYSGGRKPYFSCCRYGNIINSRGSIVPLFKEQIRTGILTITDIRMTRFFTTLDFVAKFILERIAETEGKDIFIPKMKSIEINRLADIMINNSDCKKEITEIRDGEKLHEKLMSCEETPFCYFENGFFRINRENGIINDTEWEYTSDKAERFSDDEIRELIKE